MKNSFSLPRKSLYLLSSLADSSNAIRTPFTVCHSERLKKVDRESLSLVKMSKSAKPPISVHILDTSRGRPATGVPITLFKEENGTWSSVGSGETNPDGRCDQFLTREEFSTGTYKFHYAVEEYFVKTAGFSFYPYIEVVFKIDNAGSDQNYHIPLLISPFGYSTYRGS